MLKLVRFVLLLLLAGPASAVTIDWVTVGSPNNAPDTLTNCYEASCGSVDHSYLISKYEVTNAQYAEFLNAVAAADPKALYNTNMAGDYGYGGITRSGSSGSYTYGLIAGRGSDPVTFVSFYDGARFANWLHNGQPTGAQANATTEDGAYTITPAGISANTIMRNAGATIFLPSENEWYKAAYYDAVSASFFDYPAESDVQTTCAAPGATPNTANCNNVVGNVTAVGSYTGSASPSGTFDQGGNVWEWNEQVVSGPYRGLRGGAFYNYPPSNLAASLRGADDPAFEYISVGFRVATIPEPATGLLVTTGLLGLAGWRSRGARNL